ncbi:hypothetical protein ACFY20_29730 [Streptomyces sp. NPDC001312]
MSKFECRSAHAWMTGSWFAHRVSLVELVGEHAHHDEVVVPAGEENVFP